jgi:hypothetical protein
MKPPIAHDPSPDIELPYEVKHEMLHRNDP